MLDKVLDWVKQNPKAALSLAATVGSAMGWGLPAWLGPMLQGLFTVSGG